VDEGTLTRSDFEDRRVSHGDFADEGKVGGKGVGSPMRVIRVDGVAIHGGALEFGQRVRREDVFCENPIQR
jgi:hypothetical protein